MRQNKKKIKENRKVRPKLNIIKKLMMIFKVSIFIGFVGLMGLSFVFVHDNVINSSYFKAKELIVAGNESLKTEDILDYAKLKKGINILSVNLELVRKMLLAHPAIAAVSVSRKLPHTILIKIEEQRPLAVIDLGRKFVVNTRGEIYIEKDKSVPDNLPVIKGLDYSDLKISGETKTEAFKSVMLFLELGKKSGCVLPNSLVQEIDVDKEMGLTVHTLERVKTIKIGFDNYPLKLERLRKIFLYLEEKQSFSAIDSVDLNNINRIVVHPGGITKWGHQREI